jgi:hypothetical protein
LAAKASPGVEEFAKDERDEGESTKTDDDIFHAFVIHDQVLC